MRPTAEKMIAVAALAASVAAGAFAQGWAGAFLWPAALCLVALLLGIVWLVLDLILTYSRHHANVQRIRAEVCPLSNEQLRALTLDHSNHASGFARAELMRRGQDARPPKEQLFQMLTSGNPNACGQAMVYVQVFYPELGEIVSTGSSNQDPPSVWESRIAASRDAEK